MKKMVLESQIRALQGKYKKAKEVVVALVAGLELADGETQEARGLLKKHAPTDVYYEFVDKWNKAKTAWQATLPKPPK